MVRLIEADEVLEDRFIWLQIISHLATPVS